MAQINVHEAKTHFSELVARAMAGETIIIAKAGKPVAELRPLPATDLRTPEAGLRPLTDIPKSRRVPGPDKGLVLIGDDFDDPLPGSEEYT
jgi:prevent-host-death family protein